MDKQDLYVVQTDLAKAFIYFQADKEGNLEHRHMQKGYFLVHVKLLQSLTIVVIIVGGVGEGGGCRRGGGEEV